MATRSDIYARPDVYDMEYEGAAMNDMVALRSILCPVDFSLAR